MIDTCGSFMLKFLIGFFNFLAFLAGLALLIVGIVLRTHSGNADFPKIVGESMDRAQAVANINSVAYIFITVGLFVMLLGFLGCCGALKESRGMLMTFCVIMSIVIIIEVIAICLPFAAKSELQKKTLEDFENELMTNHSLITNETCNDVNFVEMKFKCCFNETITVMCNNIGAAQQAHCKPDQPDWKVQCKDVTYWEYFEDVLLKPFGFTCLFFAILEVAALIFSCTLIYLISKQRSQYAAYA